MATLEELAQDGVLRKLVPGNLARHEFVVRHVWFYVEVLRWIKEEVPTFTAFYPENMPPLKQAHKLFRDFVLGEEFVHETDFWKMRPYSEDVYELKTNDLRFFGWFVRPRVFVVARNDTFEMVHSQQGVHLKHLGEVVRMRREIDLDEPKYTPGAPINGLF
ncbi:hypothetical protein [Ensifer soli]|uniref:hypothetical protein n=1 Tax=Ciceribacter sp. sgz301302 TaxID=3342379 RepID=UPI0035BA87EE